MRRMMDTTRRRREKQLQYNQTNGITPRAIQKSIMESLVEERKAKAVEEQVLKEEGVPYDIHAMIGEMEREMLEAAEGLEFERAAILRDQIRELKQAKPVQPAQNAGHKTLYKVSTERSPKRGGGKKRVS
jgi:excinuclease ABC subunit B